jgi:hypothetical protein
MMPKPAEPVIAAPNLLNAKTPEDRLAPNESSIVLYAEFLLHIRTVTLFASLRTVHTRETKAKLATNGCSITVTHEDESATIHLPIKVRGGGDAALSLPAQPSSKELTLRLQIEEQEGTELLGTLLSEERKANIVPWDGAMLNGMEHGNIHCKSCHAIVVSKEKIREWRDLPNENWAEMMDFWHCHKPDEHHLHDHTHDAALGEKGYAAGNRLKALKGVGFVDITSFLLQEHDLEGARVGHFLSSFFCKALPGAKKATLAFSMAVSSIQSPQSNRLLILSLQCRADPLLWDDGFAGAVTELPGRFTTICPEAIGNGGIRSGYIHCSLNSSVYLSYLQRLCMPKYSY